jgi:hypothetical protein
MTDKRFGFLLTLTAFTSLACGTHPAVAANCADL